jgi:hypothetical protein
MGIADGTILTRGQLVHPIVFLKISLNHLDVGRLAHGREIHARVGDHALAALDGEAQQLRQVGTLVEPVGVAPQQFKRLGVPRITGFDQAVHQPGAGVGAALGIEDGVLGIVQ